MTIGTKNLADCANACIATTCNPLEILQLSSIARDFDQGFVKSVANCAALPSAASNKGRWIYLQDTCSYRWSDGTSWSNDFTSVPENFAAYVWGLNSFGQLGNNTTTTSSSPVSTVGGFSDWCQVSAGLNHTLAARTNGTLWSWGANYYGKLGDNTTISRSSPVSVVGGFTDWRQASAGRNHSLAVRTNGTAWSWGYNIWGQLGDNTSGVVASKRSPVSVVGGFTDWNRVSAGVNHSLGVRSSGTIYSWGDNNQGQLGDNTNSGKSSPVAVAGGFSDWCQASAGGYHSLGVRTNGTLWSWGSNTSGQLGDNSNIARSSPVSVVGGFTDWCQVSAGFSHTLALRTNGSLWSWGYNGYGALGINNTTVQSSPVSVVGGFTNWCQASAGDRFSLAVRTDGSLWSWGNNYYGKLGDNTTTNRSSPVSVVGGSSGWCQSSAGGFHAAALKSSKGF